MLGRIPIRWPREVSDWDLRLLREHRKTLALDSGLPARLVLLPFINCLSKFTFLSETVLY